MATKLRQMVRAIEIERALTKDEILALYLDLAPYGGNIEGIRAASLAYFGKEPRRLSLGEAALLVALPQSPELRRPDRFAESARAARDRVLDRFAATGAVPADEIALAKTEPVPTGRRPMPLLAPHARRQGRRRADAIESASAHHRRRHAKESGKSCARARPHACRDARPRRLARHSRRRQRDRRHFGQRRLAGLFRPAPRRPSRHDAGVALARLDAQAVHLRVWLRGRRDQSGDADRGPAGGLRQLRAEGFRFLFPRNGDSPKGAAALAQRSGDRRARRSRRQPAHRANRPGRRHRWCCRRAKRPAWPSVSAASA